LTIDLLVKWVNSEEFLGGKSKCEDTGIEVDERERLEKFGISLRTRWREATMHFHSEF
jgi:hypothetical protein